MTLSLALFLVIAATQLSLFQRVQVAPLSLSPNKVAPFRLQVGDPSAQQALSSCCVKRQNAAAEFQLLCSVAPSWEQGAVIGRLALTGALLTEKKSFLGSPWLEKPEFSVIDFQTKSLVNRQGTILRSASLRKFSRK